MAHLALAFECGEGRSMPGWSAQGWGAWEHAANKSWWLHQEKSLQHQHSSLLLLSCVLQSSESVQTREEVGTQLLWHDEEYHIAQEERELESNAGSREINPSKGHTVVWLDTWCECRGTDLLFASEWEYKWENQLWPLPPLKDRSRTQCAAPPKEQGRPSTATRLAGSLGKSSHWTFFC